MRRLIVPLLVAALLPLPAISQEPEPGLTPLTERADIVALLASYAGAWTGRGESRADFDADMEPVACSLRTEFDSATDTLDNDGTCASTARQVPIDGQLMVGPDGALSGGYFGRFEDRAELLESSGIAYEEGFIVHARYLVTTRGEQREVALQIRVSVPILRGDGRTGFSLVVRMLDAEADEYVDFTRLEFLLNR